MPIVHLGLRSGAIQKIVKEETVSELGNKLMRQIGRKQREYAVTVLPVIVDLPVPRWKCCGTMLAAAWLPACCPKCGEMRS